MFLNLDAKYVKMSIAVPAYAPTGINRRSEFNGVNPKLDIMMGMNADIGPGSYVSYSQMPSKV